MTIVNFKKEIWEGWTIGDIIKENQSDLDMVASGCGIGRPFRTRADIKTYLKENLMPAGCRKTAVVNELVKYFAPRYGL